MLSQDQLQELWDKQALHDNLMRYCRALDRMDRDGIVATYWPDSWDDHAVYIGPGQQWADEALRWKDKSWQVNHHVSNVYSEIDGTRAKRESMFIVVCDFKESGMSMLEGGRYRDLCEKRDGEWRILNRVCIWDWSQEIPTKPAWGQIGQPRVTNWGDKWPDDPIYKDWSKSEPRPYPRDDGSFPS